MKYPKSIKENSNIAFVAPSLGCGREPYRSAFLSAVNRFQDLGYGVALGPNCFEEKGFVLSNEPQLTGKELTDCYCDPRFSALISCGGGELMCRTIEHVDWNRIREAAPKWFMGYSDNTNFGFLLNTLCDTACIYGPNAPAFGQAQLHPAVTDAIGALQGKREFKNYPAWEKESRKTPENPLVSYNCTEPYEHKLYDASHRRAESLVSEGRLIGGCLDILVSLCGTTFDRVPEFCAKYKEDGIIWFLECCDLQPLELVRAVWRMKYCGWMKNVKAVILGRPYMYEQTEISWETAVLEAFKDFPVPVICDADIGHLPPAMPLISGAFAQIRADKELRIKFIER